MSVRGLCECVENAFVAREAIVSTVPTKDYSKYQFGNTYIIQVLP